MAGKARRLKFTEDELENPKLAKAAGRKAHLTFEKQEVPVGQLTGRGNRFTRSAVHSVTETASGTLHSQIAENNQDDNAAVQAADSAAGTAETGAHVVDHAVYSKKLKTYEKAEKLQTKSDAANVEAVFQKRKAEHPEAFSNPVSRWQQRRAIRKEYAAALRAKEAAGNAANAGTAASKASAAIQSVGKKLSDLKDQVFMFAAKNPHLLLAIGILALLVMVISSSMSSCSAFLPGGSGSVVATTFTAEDEDITGANEDYKALEAGLQSQIDDIKSDYPGYDEYNFYLDEIGHDPYQLTAYLTALFENFKRADVQSALQSIFDLQYDLKIEEVVEIRTRTVESSSTDPETGEETSDSYEEEYEYYILNVTLTNKDMGHVITESGKMTDDQAERYAILLQTKGNKAYLFADDPYASASADDILQYEIPGEALTDTKFANMIHEAEKYLGYPYVWGGSSPSTSFDCSGFVSWVINHCGNGWKVGRQTANGLKSRCSIIPASAAKPGDLIFFRGTYNTSGASHVGIYVGNGMMIHCGNPIQYASINTSYWQQHFYCFGRLPN